MPFSSLSRRLHELKHDTCESMRSRAHSWESNRLRKPDRSHQVPIKKKSPEIDPVEIPQTRDRCRTTPAIEISAQRFLKKQRYFGSVELLISVDNNGKIRNMGRFRIEQGDKSGSGALSRKSAYGTSSGPVFLENPEIETRWYFKYFLGKEHQNYAGLDGKKQPFFLSTMVDEGCDGNLLRERAILWTNKGSKRLCLPYNYPKGNSARSIVKQFSTMQDHDCALKEIHNPRIQKDLVILEEQEGSVNFKFGVVFARSGQETDYRMLSNEQGNEAFEIFIKLLGEEIELNGWNKYKGGLDTKSNSTGKTSVYTVFEGHEVMFHVSTRLPHSSVNEQQVERKRHIGNDIVNIVFETDCDPDQPTFNPSKMKSQFTHIFALVTHCAEDDCFRLRVYSEESVPPFGPPLPSPPVFHNHTEFRDFLLTKLINGEKAAFHSQVFSEKRERTMDLLIKDMYMEYLNDLHKPLSRVDSVLSKNRSARKDERVMEFIKVGQTLKLEKVLSGDAPTSLVSSFYRKQPWEPYQLPSDLNIVPSAGDSWGSCYMFVASEQGGLYFLNVETGPAMLILDRSFLFRQVTVLDNYGIVLLRSAEKGKDGYLYVFKLDTLKSVIRNNNVLEKADCKNQRVECSKSCHLYAVSQGHQLRLHVAVAVGHHLRLLQWKYSVSCPNWCVSEDNLPSNFELIKDIPLSDEPLVLTLFEMQSLQLCIGYKYQFELVSCKAPETSQVVLRSENKILSSGIVDNCDDEQSELLITYNNVSIFCDLSGKEKQAPVKIYWNSTPLSIVYVFPFVISFSCDTVEVRLAVNGSLLATLYMPNLKLISNKSDIFFASAIVDTGGPNMMNRSGSFDTAFKILLNPTTVTSPVKDQPLSLYKIPLSQLLGNTHGVVNSGSQRKLPKAPAVDTLQTHIPLGKQRSNPTYMPGTDHLVLHETASGGAVTANRNKLTPASALATSKPVNNRFSAIKHDAVDRVPSANSDSGLSSQNSVDLAQSQCA